MERIKKNRKLTLTMLTFVLIALVAIFGTSAFASSDDETDTTEEVSSTDTVSGCDLNADTLVTVTVEQYGFSMLIPEEGYLTSIEAPAENFETVGYSRPYFIEQSCLMQVFTDSDNYCAVSLFIEELDSIYDYYGDYSSLTEEQQQELIDEALDDGNESAQFVSINGQTYLEAYVTDSDDDALYEQYQLTTVIDRKEYTIYIQTANANSSDKDVINTMIGSIKLKGMTESLTAVEITLIVVCVILVLTVALAYFFLFRLNAWAKVGVRDCAIVGFNLPKVEKSSDDLDDEDDEDDDEDEDGDEDDDDELEEDEDEDDDDERIIKD